eukprot:256889_1
MAFTLFIAITFHVLSINIVYGYEKCGERSNVLIHTRPGEPNVHCIQANEYSALREYINNNPCEGDCITDKCGSAIDDDDKRRSCPHSKSLSPIVTGDISKQAASAEGPCKWKGTCKLTEKWHPGYRAVCRKEFYDSPLSWLFSMANCQADSPGTFCSTKCTQDIDPTLTCAKFTENFYPSTAKRVDVASGDLKYAGYWACKSDGVAGYQKVCVKPTTRTARSRTQDLNLYYAESYHDQFNAVEEVDEYVYDLAVGELDDSIYDLAVEELRIDSRLKRLQRVKQNIMKSKRKMK